ncbi:MAG TPA: DUF3500 domain-containing protein [Longimicrobiales bacterium]
MTRRPRRAATVASAAALILLTHSSARPLQQQRQLEEFRGVTTNGTLVPDLFPLRATGVSTEPMREAANAFIEGLTPAQRERTLFPAGADEWRLWNNVHRYQRAGTSFEEMTDAQRAIAFDMIRAGLSARGFEKSRNVMRLNGHLADVLERPGEYGEFLYWLTIMGTPSATEPWGWQLDGHHLIINYFVLGDQVVMTPTFMGSEPVIATTGRFAGARVMQEEQDRGLAFMRTLDAEQRSRATIQLEKARNNALAQAFRDNLVLDYAGIRATGLTATQREQLLQVIAEYVDNMSPGHARVRMSEVREHLDDTWFAWIGDVGDDAVFYYRIQSPVILIEFDHQMPVALSGPRVPNREHVHSVVRTPNGNDYGRDLLRQHYERHRNDPDHGH